MFSDLHESSDAHPTKSRKNFDIRFLMPYFQNSIDMSEYGQNVTEVQNTHLLLLGLYSFYSHSKQKIVYSPILFNFQKKSLKLSCVKQHLKRSQCLRR